MHELEGRTVTIACMTVFRALKRPKRMGLSVLRLGLVLFLAVVFTASAILQTGGSHADASSIEDVRPASAQSVDCGETPASVDCDRTTQRDDQRPCDSDQCVSNPVCFVCAPVPAAGNWQPSNNEIGRLDPMPVFSSADLQRLKRPPRPSAMI